MCSISFPSYSALPDPGGAPWCGGSCWRMVSDHTRVLRYLRHGRWKPAPLIGGRGTFTPAQRTLQVFNFQRMSAGDQNVLSFGADISFLVFDAAAGDASANLELYRLPFAGNVITQPDGLAQVGAMPDQMGGRQMQTRAPSRLQSKWWRSWTHSKSNCFRSRYPGSHKWPNLCLAQSWKPDCTVSLRFVCRADRRSLYNSYSR